MENLKLLLKLFFLPNSAMSEIMDKGSWVFAAVLVLLVSMLFFATINTKLDKVYRIPDFGEFYQPNFNNVDEDSPATRKEYEKSADAYGKAMAERQKILLIGDYFFNLFSFEPGKFFQPLLSLSIFYIPVLILLMCLFGSVGNFGIVLRRDYGTLAVCSLMAWGAAHLPFAMAGIFLYSQAIWPSIYLGMWVASSILFGILMVAALRTVFGTNYNVAIIVTGIAWPALSLGTFIFQHISPWLFSPFLLFYAFIYLGGFLSGEARGFGNAFRQRRNFKRFLQNSTVNPKDADAHVQLGLIYMQRRQESMAREHFEKAIRIDENEIDANYEMGKINRGKGNLQEALNNFSIVVEQNDKHALSEVWREIGVTYFSAHMLAEACDALEKFVHRRSADVEGLYYLGKVLKAQGEKEKAKEMFERAINSAQTAPDFRRGTVKQWSKLAKKEI